MADEEPVLTLSLMERLTDEHPDAPDTARERWPGLPELVMSVRSHLETLLNTRRSEQDLDVRFEQCNNSVLAYGIMDFTSISLSDPGERERLRRSIERALRLFEPRLSRVDVKLTGPENNTQSLDFSIEGLLRIEPEPAPVFFDASLAKDARHFSVRGEL